MNYNRNEWNKIFQNLCLSAIAPSSDDEWEKFFSKSNLTSDPEKYDNLRKGVVLGLREDKYSREDFNLLYNGIKALISLSPDNDEIALCNEFLNIAKEYICKGDNLINFEYNERIAFAKNRLCSCLLVLE